MAKRTKSVFNEQDFDDIMPPTLQRPADEPPARAAGTTAADLTPAPPVPPVEPDTVGETQRPVDGQSGVVPRRRRRAAGSVPTAEVAPDVFQLLRRLTSREKGRDPISARTYAQVVMDAIEAHQQQLAVHWQLQEAAEADGGGGLFSRRPAAPLRRRRHAKPPARVPLTGLNPADAEVLDRLVGTWAAPSRSSLVEQALRLYLMD